MDLSIIIPVYNVEKYIRPCFISLFKQGLHEDDYEIIIVNDGSTDDSMRMIEDIIAQHNNITIINQENQGLSVARNNGIAAAKGDYILMPDSDDLLIENSLSSLLEIVKETKCDIIRANFIILNDYGIEHYQGFTQKTITIEKTTGHKLYLNDFNPHQCYVWRCLFRKAFITDNKISFYPGIFFQDVPFTHECYLRARTCIITNITLNIYRKGRNGAATSSFSTKKGRDLCIAIGRTWELTNIEGLPEIVNIKLKDYIFISFSVLVYWTIETIHSKADRKQIICYLKKYAPHLKFKNGLKQKSISFMLNIMPNTYLQIRYLLFKLKH